MVAHYERGLVVLSMVSKIIHSEDAAEFCTFYIFDNFFADSRYRIKDGTLAIDDITYDDRKTYICVGSYNNGTEILKQAITLRVKGKPPAYRSGCRPKSRYHKHSFT